MRSAMEKILILLRTRTGHDFTFYKRNTLYRRIERRMGIHQIDKIASYVRFLQENPQELDLLFKEFLIGVTTFFRDPLVWKIVARRDSSGACWQVVRQGLLRAWVAGCSTGEEAYTLAIVFKEVMEKLKPKKSFKLQIFATDLDRDAIDKARQGVFPENISADVSPEQLRRFFTKEDRGYRVRTEIREMVIFPPHSLIMDPPFTKLDFLSCRNLLIYLAPEMQKKLLPLFHYSLNPGGILLLGNAETVGHFTDLFATVSGKARIFRRTESAVPPEPIEFPSSFAPALTGGREHEPGTKPYLNLQTQAEQLVLRRYAPPTVLVNDQGNILYISGRTGKYLEPAVGKANLNIFAMAREGLRYELSTAFQKALRQDGPVTLHGLKIGTNGGQQYADVTVEKLEDTEPLAGLVMIVFRDIAAPAETKAPARERQTVGGQPPPGGIRARIATGPGGTAQHARGDAELAGGTQIHQRGNAVHQRGNAVHQRGTHHFQGGNAVLERGTANGERRAAGQTRRVVPLQQRHEEPAQQHGRRHAVSGQRPQGPPLHHAGHQDHQAHPGRCGPAHHRPRVRPALSGIAGRRPRSAAETRIHRETGQHARRTLVHGAHHALPDAGRPH